MVTKKKKWPFVLLLLVGCIGAYVMWRITAPLPEIKTSVVYRASSAPQPQAFMWPENGESAIAIEGQGVVAQKNQQETVQPIASTAKLITALAILEKKPLKINEKGPVITLNQADVDIFNSYYVRDGST
jgi:D-alanyl-D-alanine carboxypeptidase